MAFHHCLATLSAKANAGRDACSMLWTTFGWKMLLLLACNFALVKGLAYSILSNVQLPFFQLIHVSAVEYATLGNVANTAWAMVPLVGIVSDMLPICGRRRSFYMVGYSVMGCSAMMVLAILPARHGTDLIAALLFFVATLAVAALGLLYQGRYTELMVGQGNNGVLLVTYVQVVYYIGSTIGAGIEGPISQYVSPRICFWIVAPLFLLQVPPLLLGWLNEKTTPLRTTCNAEQFYLKKELIGLSVFMTAVALWVMLFQMYESLERQLISALAGSAAVLVASFFVFPRPIAKAGLFLYIKNTCWVSIGSILQYWYTMSAPCVANGPDFSITYFQTYAGIFANLAPLAGALIFQVFLAKKKFLFVFVLTALIKTASAVFDIIMVRRWNVNELGISDQVMYLLGDAVTQQLCYMLAYMPMAILISRLCPKGVESTLFGVLAGFESLGQTTAVIIGVYLANALTIDTGSSAGSSAGSSNADPCNWSRLTELIIIAHGIAPLLVLPAAYFLLPDTVITEDMRDVLTSFMSETDKTRVSEKWAEEEYLPLVPSERIGFASSSHHRDTPRAYSTTFVN